MNIVLVVGPSGVGKSTAIELVKRHLERVVFHSLDDLAALFGAGQKLFEKACVQSFGDISTMMSGSWSSA